MSIIQYSFSNEEFFLLSRTQALALVYKSSKERVCNVR